MAARLPSTIILSMSLRIGFDMDGVLADFATAYYAIEERLFGPKPHRHVDDPEEAAGARETRRPTPRRHKDEIWRAIRQTPDFWLSLKEAEPGAVKRLYELALPLRWEVFFITQRPETAGDTVQRQTQRWLVEHGFDLPSVVVVPGSRGAAAAALSLDYHVDDSPKNCLDIHSGAATRVIRIVHDDDDTAVAGARLLGIATASGIAEALDVLERATALRTRPQLLQQLAALVGWK